MATVADVLGSKGAGVYGISAKSTVFEAIGEMSRHSVGCLVVCDGENGPVGLITERDYLRRVALEGRSSKTTLVEEIMSRPIVSVTREATITECMNIMTHRRLRHLPVIEGVELVGIVSIGDMVKYELRLRGELIDEMLGYIGRYPPESSRPSSH